MNEPFDHEDAQKCIRSIVDVEGMTVLTSTLKEDQSRSDMTSLDVVNVLRGGNISKALQTATGWRYRAATKRMTVEFSFRWNQRLPGAMPDELVIERAWRNDR